MRSTLLIASLFLPIAFSYSQYCESGGPSSTADSNLEQLSIVGASGSINYTGCPAVTGVQYHSSETVTLNAGSSYALTVKFGTCGGNYSGVGEAWIDFNGNQVFEASESILTWSGTPPVAAANYAVTVPANAMSGLQRMRVIQAEGMSLPMDPCASFTWGSVTDFNVMLQGGIDCSGYVGDDRNDPRLVPSIPFVESYSTAICYSNQSFAYNSPDVFYKIVPGNLEAIKISLCGSSFDTFLSIQDQNGMAIYGNDDSPNCPTASELEFSTVGYDTLYAVVEGWGLYSGDYMITITAGSLGLDAAEANSLHIYPNPSSGLFHFNEAMSGTMHVYSMEGKAVFQKDLEQTKTIDLSHLPKGIYWIDFLRNDQRLTQKISIQ